MTSILFVVISTKFHVVYRARDGNSPSDSNVERSNARFPFEGLLMSFRGFVAENRRDGKAKLASIGPTWFRCVFDGCGDVMGGLGDGAGHTGIQNHYRRRRYSLGRGGRHQTIVATHPPPRLFAPRMPGRLLFSS